MVNTRKEGFMNPYGVTEGATSTVPYTPSASRTCVHEKCVCGCVCACMRVCVCVCVVSVRHVM